MNRTKLPIHERIGNVPQFPVGVDAAVAEVGATNRLELKLKKNKIMKDIEIIRIMRRYIDNVESMLPKTVINTKDEDKDDDEQGKDEHKSLGSDHGHSRISSGSNKDGKSSKDEKKGRNKDGEKKESDKDVKDTKKTPISQKSLTQKTQKLMPSQTETPTIQTSKPKMPSQSVCPNIWLSFNMAFGGVGYALSYPLSKAVAKNLDLCLKKISNFVWK
ncbi:hypothetical protein AgCh_026481 [Apium graveolens]